MMIDDDRNLYDLSDHNLLFATFITQINKGRKSKAPRERYEYLKINDETSKNFLEEMENRCREEIPTSIDDFERYIEESAGKTMKVERQVKKLNNSKKEPPWITDEIRKNIKQRKLLNRICRNCNKGKIDTAKKDYQIQKEKTQSLIRAAIDQYERTTTLAIKTDKSKRKLWDQIKKLQGTKKIKKDVKLVLDTKDNPQTNEDGKEEIKAFWEKIYKKHPNDAQLSWNPEQINDYMSKLDYLSENGPIIVEETEQRFPNILIEHLHAAVEIKERINETMNKPTITLTDIEINLSKIRSGKAPGPNGIKNELLKIMSKSKICKEILLIFFNRILNTGNIPQSWKTSKTTMIPKISKPKVKDLRPIALINGSYKLFMSILREKIETHLTENLKMENLQAGFTANRQVEDNLFLLNYCVNESYRNNKQLILTAIDFSKAFDSIKRSALINSLKEYNVHPDIIAAIFNIYDGDNTDIFFNKEKVTNVKITSGIRQGCTGSTALFKLVTYIIIKELKETGYGFKNKHCRIPVLFFADDGLLLSNTKEEAEKFIQALQRTIVKCGLEINELKSKILIFNKKEDFDQLENIEVADTVKYLGINIMAHKDIFSQHKEYLKNRATQLANILPAVSHRSSNKLLIGKTYWKNVCIPRLLFASSVIPMNQEFIQNLQKSENRAFRCLFNAPKFTPICSLRGEVGASLMISRLHKNKLNYLKHLLTSENELINKIAITQLQEKKSPWGKEMHKILNKYNIDVELIKILSKKEIKDKVTKIDTESWNTNVEQKSSLEIYRKFKTEIKEENIYTNSYASNLLFRCRTNTLILNDRKRFSNEDTSCPCCGHGVEDLIHVLLFCPKYATARNEVQLLQQPYPEDMDPILKQILLFTNRTEEEQQSVKNYIKRIYLIRQRKVDQDTLEMNAQFD